MKKQLLLLLATFFFSTLAHAGYQCSALLDDDGNLGRVVVTLDVLDKDPEVLQTLRDLFYFEDATFVKYQYWIDAGQGFHMVHFIGVSNELNRDGSPELVTKNLFCKDDGFVEEPFF
jgi:hypothetical protein